MDRHSESGRHENIIVHYNIYLLHDVSYLRTELIIIYLLYLISLCLSYSTLKLNISIFFDFRKWFWIWSPKNIFLHELSRGSLCAWGNVLCRLVVVGCYNSLFIHETKAMWQCCGDYSTFLTHKNSWTETSWCKPVVASIIPPKLVRLTVVWLC